MDFERALETQRLALLRLLAGLTFVVAALSYAPAVSMVPNWVGSSVASLLKRIEAAADSLVIVAARVFCGYRGDICLGSPSTFEAKAGITAERLLRRIAALRAILEDLPRYARRFVKRLTRTRTAMPTEWPALALDGLTPRINRVVARIERPPDKIAHASG